MKVFATIDQGVIISSPEISFLPNKNGIEYEVNHTGQLVIKNGKIEVDLSIPDPIELYKKKMIDQGRLNQLNNIISNHIIEKELYNNGIVDDLSISDQEYKNILIEYKELKSKLL